MSYASAVTSRYPASVKRSTSLASVDGLQLMYTTRSGCIAAISCTTDSATPFPLWACNNQETNRYANNSLVSERALREIYLKGFGICIKEADPASVMTSYNLINGTHTSESFELTTNILRDEFGFKGLVMTDWVIASDFLMKDPKYPAPDAARVAKAGCSLFMPGSKKEFSQIMEGLKNGSVSREQLQRNAAWLLKVSERLGK